MKNLVLFAALFTIILPVYRQEKSSKAESHQKRTKDVKSQETASPIAPPSTEINAINQQASDTQKDGTKNHPESYFRRLFSPENIPNIGLFLAGMIGIIVAICTLKSIDRSTKASEKSVALQEVLNQQWLEFENWEVVNGGTLDEADRFILILSFDVANTTKMPLTLETVEVNFDGKKIDFSNRNTLAPGRKYPVRADTLLGEGSSRVLSNWKMHLECHWIGWIHRCLWKEKMPSL